MSKLNDKVAVVTGGSSGIGLATAQRFIADGAQVVITGRNPEALDAAVAELGDRTTGRKLMNYITSRNISLAFGLPFVAAGLIGFVSNPVLSPNGLFEVNLMHNLLHVSVGVVFIIGAMSSETAARRTLQSLSIAGVALAILGFVAKSDLLLGLVHVNEADKWLHAGLAIVIVAAAFGIPRPQASQASSAE